MPSSACKKKLDTRVTQPRASGCIRDADCCHLFLSPPSPPPGSPLFPYTTLFRSGPGIDVHPAVLLHIDRSGIQAHHVSGPPLGGVLGDAPPRTPPRGGPLKIGRAHV